MSNRIVNAISEYNKRFRNTKEGRFSASDLRDVCNAAEHKGHAGAAWSGLMAGFMIGYRKGLRDAKRQQAHMEHMQNTQELKTV